MLFGADHRGVTRASCFPGALADAARKAAGLMQLRRIEVTPAIEVLARKLPAGRIYTNGTASVPTVPRQLFLKLIDAADLDPELFSAASDEACRVPFKRAAVGWEDQPSGIWYWPKTMIWRPGGRPW